MGEILLELLLKHRGKVLGVVLGLIVGWVVIAYGLWALLVLLVFLAVGYFFGRLVDEEGGFWEAVDRLFPSRRR